MSRNARFTPTRFSKVRLLVVDDHALVLNALSRLLAEQPWIEVVGEATRAAEAVEVALRTRPDVIVMDIDMPGLICFDAVRRLRPQLPEAKIVFLSAFVHDGYIEQAIAAGAVGYVTKQEPSDRLVEAIRKVARGEAVFSDAILSRLVVTPDGLRLDAGAPTRLSTLTTREMEILRYIACGLSKRQVAAEIHISEKTVDAHTTSLMRKLDIHDRVELARFAIREGIAEP